MRIQHKVYNENYNTEKNKKISRKLFEDYKFTYESNCPLSWVEEVYELLKDITKIHPEIVFEELNEDNGKLVLKYLLYKKDLEVEKLISYTTYALCKKGVMFKESVRRVTDGGL